MKYSRFVNKISDTWENEVIMLNNIYNLRNKMMDDDELFEGKPFIFVDEENNLKLGIVKSFELDDQRPYFHGNITHCNDKFWDQYGNEYHCIWIRTGNVY